MATAERDQSVTFRSDQAEDACQNAYAELVQLTIQAREFLRPKKGDGSIRGDNRPPSLNTMDDSSRRLVLKAIQKERLDGSPKAQEPVSLEVYKKLLEHKGVRGQQAIDLVNAYTVAWLRRELAKCVMLFRSLLEDGSNLRITTTVAEMHARITTRTVEITTGVEEVTLIEQEMGKSNRFGYVSRVGPGFQLVGFSEPAASLFKMPAQRLNGSYLLGSLIRTTAQNLLTRQTFHEWCLMVGMLAWTTARRWNSEADGHGGGEEVAAYFRWLEQYVRQNYQAVKADVDASPTMLINGRTRKQDLYQSLKAAVGNAEWPLYHLDRWNAVRWHIDKHPLLAGRAVARFEKIARPIPTADHPVAYEILVQPERYDPVASELMRAILAELGYLDQ